MSAVSSRTIVLVEDDARLGSIVQLLAKGVFDVRLAPTGRAAQELLAQGPPEAVLVDLGLPDVDGVELIQWIRERHPRVPVLVLSVVSAEARIFAALRAGACGYLFKEDLGQHLLPAIDEALAGGAPMSREVALKLVEHLRRGQPPAPEAPPSPGEPWRALTPKELAVLERFARGERYEEAALSLDVTVNTVRSHARAIYEKLDVTSKTEAVVVAMNRGILPAQRS